MSRGPNAGRVSISPSPWVNFGAVDTRRVSNYPDHEEFDADDRPDEELEELEEELVDKASAARTIAELGTEMERRQRPGGSF